LERIEESGEDEREEILERLFSSLEESSGRLVRRRGSRDMSKMDRREENEERGEDSEEKMVGRRIALL
jgi:hypothetical protein